MTRFPTSNRDTQLREHLGTRVYMASHPALRPYMRRGLRPVEFGDRVWPAALCAMSHVAVDATDRVVEIGCGWGIVGIHLARTCGARVTCTDADPRLQPFVDAHASLNGVAVPFEAHSFADLAQDPSVADVIVGSDICYSDEVVADLIRLVDASAAAGVRRFVITDAGRPDFETLLTHCQAGFDCVVQVHADDTSRPIRLLEVRLPGT
ncbi:MAG: methyltransferase [Vicinamibacterales bacterium]